MRLSDREKDQPLAYTITLAGAFALLVGLDASSYISQIPSGSPVRHSRIYHLYYTLSGILVVGGGSFFMAGIRMIVSAV